MGLLHPIPAAPCPLSPPHQPPLHCHSTSPGHGSGARDSPPEARLVQGGPVPTTRRTAMRPSLWLHGGCRRRAQPPTPTGGWAGVPGSVWVSRGIQPHAMASAGRLSPAGGPRAQLWWGILPRAGGSRWWGELWLHPLH